MDYFSWVFFGPAKLLALWPYAGLVIAGVLIALQAWLSWRAHKPFDSGFFRMAPVFAGLLWLIFTAFEWQMSALAAKMEVGFLRMDLIVLVPILYVLTIAGALSLARQINTPAKPGQPDSDP